jgi:hypothetical protein
MNSWLVLLAKLPPDFEGQVAPHVLIPRMIPMFKNLTFKDVAQRQFGKRTWLEQSAILSVIDDIEVEFNTKWSQQQLKERNAGFGKIEHQKWKFDPPEGSEMSIMHAELELKNTGKKLVGLLTQKEMYQLSISHLIPPVNDFRVKITADYGMDWSRVNGKTLFSHSRLETFMWKSCNGKLYGNKMLKIFRVKDEAECWFCKQADQSFEHVMLECAAGRAIFARFASTYGAPVSDCEKLVGLNTNIPRKPGWLKRLNVVRKYVYDCNRKDKIMTWEGAVASWERVYVEEYAIGDRQDRLIHILTAWEL